MQTQSTDNKLHPNVRIRHELKFRQLTVKTVEELTPTMRRVILTDKSLSDFISPGFDDHIKVFFPPIGQSFIPPIITDKGIEFDGEKPEMRDYTPRAYDNEKQILTLDFALHETGIATDWARFAKVGDTLNIAGPRGSMIIPMDFDGYVLIGDETALPAIARRLEELPDEALTLVIAEVNSVMDELPLPNKSNTNIVWLHRNGTPIGQADLFLQALQNYDLPTGDIHVWIATETKVAQQLRDTLYGNPNVNKDYVKATGYWQC